MVDGLRQQPGGFRLPILSIRIPHPSENLPRKRGTAGRKIKNAASRLVQFDVNPFAINRTSRKFVSKKREKSQKIELFPPKITEIRGKLHARPMACRSHRRSSPNEKSQLNPAISVAESPPEMPLRLSPRRPNGPRRRAPAPQTRKAPDPGNFHNVVCSAPPQ